MRLYKVILLVNLAVGVGFLLGSLWWAQEVGRLRREVATRGPGGTASSAGAARWLAQGVVRGVAPEIKRVVIEHGDIPCLMEAMTMAFEPEDPALLHGLSPGDQVYFTLQKRGDRLTLIAIEKRLSP
jgi:Cu/Ag efflux protein CusF